MRFFVLLYVYLVYRTIVLCYNNEIDFYNLESVEPVVHR